MNVCKAVERFRLDLLPLDWVNNILRSDFTELSEIPTVYENEIGNDVCNTLMVECINEIKVCLYSVIDAPSESNSLTTPVTPISWNILQGQYQINYKPLLCLVSSFLNISEDNATEEDKYFALCSARLYVNLLSIPGAWICKVFNPLLFDKTMNSLNIVLLLIQKNENDGRAPITGQLINLLDDLSTCLKKFKFKEEFNSLLQILKVLVDMTRLEKRKHVLDIVCNDPSSIIAIKSYMLLEQLCTEAHGDIKVTVTRIMYFFLPSLEIDDKQRSNETERIAIKSHTFLFIRQLIRILKQEHLSGIKALVQHLSIRVSEKSDVRLRSIGEIVELLSMLPYPTFENLMLWVCSLAFGEVVNHRMCAIEILSEVLNQCNHSNINSNPVEKKLMKCIFSVILSRCIDISPIVRYKTLAILANSIHSGTGLIMEFVQGIFCDDTSNDKDLFDFHEYIDQFNSAIPVPDDTLPSANIFLDHIETFTYDNRVFVRKYAVRTLINVLLLDSRWITKPRLELITCRHLDRSVLIRKEVSKCLTDLLFKYPSNDEVIDAWVEAVIPLINDIERKSQEQATGFMEKVIITNIVPYSQTPEPLNELPWKILSRILVKEKTVYFNNICKKWVTEKIIQEEFIKTLKTHIETENNTTVWFFITCLSEQKEIPCPDFIYEYFVNKLNISRSSEDYLNHMVVTSLCLNRTGLHNDIKEELNTSLKISVENFNVRAPFVPQYMDMVYLFDPNASKVWSGKLIKKCERYLQDKIAPRRSISVNDEDHMCRCIITLGEAANFCPGVNKDVVDYIAHIIDPEFLKTEIKRKGNVSGKVKAASVITLGKLCLQDIITAKKYSPIFARNLISLSSYPPIKVNSMAALTDLYMRYSSLVNNFLPNMYVSLRDSDMSVRKNSFVLLSKIIQEDCLKLKSPLIFYLLVMLVDTSTEIKDIAEDFFINFVMRKYPVMLSRIFVLTIFFFNDYQVNELAVGNITTTEKKYFSLAGDNFFNERGRIYKFMLKYMTDDDKFITFNSLCTNILEQVSKNELPLNATGNSVLKDALFTMSCDEIRLRSTKISFPDEEVEHDNMDNAEQATKQAVVYGLARKMFLNKFVKKNYIESIIPVIINLKKKLFEMKSPLAKDLMICLGHMMKDFKKEIDEIIAADPLLAAEVKFDLRGIDILSTDEEDLIGLNLLGIEGNEGPELDQVQNVNAGASSSL